MAIAVWQHRIRMLHVPVMVSVMVVDMFFPVYLVFTRDWTRRLIEEGEIFSFMIWMHLMLVIVMYMLYFFQLKTVRTMLSGQKTERAEHRSQGRAILVTRLMVILTAMLLVDPEGRGVE